jgi:Rha family phage regulatory protein
MSLHHDLFPESLVVTLVDGQPMTSSLEIAEHFGKRHKNVIQSIENLITNCPDSEFSQLNFQPAEYLDAQKKPRIEYRLTHDGFAFLAMRFTGKEAMAWQIAFLQAFNALEAELRAKEARFAQALDQIRPTLRPIVEGTEQGQSRADIAAPLGKSVNSVTYHRRKARELGLLPKSA